MSGEEYDKAVVELHEAMPENPGREYLRTIRRAEVMLAIDFRLGRYFPPERRAALWAVHERLESRWLWYTFWHIVSFKWLRNYFSPPSFSLDAGLASWVVAEYAKVLSEEELVSYFEDD